MKYLVLAWIHTADFIQRLLKEEKGASAIEYVLIAAVVVAAVTALGLPDIIEGAGEKLSNAVSSAG
ncbi:Flp family type IVb pilin [Photobacterium salinisoli]|uniref:Flp family type IVb pilin n=1 Tax=Photobacterium salinisoli TaxID=1616783 RepID=UPI000EA1C360|nr:Flp family type IVb pilin [Photobacterium salinisoli]